MDIKIIEIQRSAIDRFKKSWPCHGIPDNVDLIMAGFENGNLFDFELVDANDEQIDLCQYEQSEALEALLQDAEKYASKRTTVPEMIDQGYLYK